MDTNDIIGAIWEALSTAVDMLPRPLETPYEHVRRLRKIEYKDYYDAMYRMKKRGLVSFQKRQGKNYISLTREGALEMLLNKANIQKTQEWDKKWRVCIFDIPEDAHLERDRLRWLLKSYGFYKLQASVFISPYSLNREAIAYLQETGLNKYIRFLKVEEMDNDADLKKVFGL
jgi:CRISPR-associated endonuclease Cas2